MMKSLCLVFVINLPPTYGKLVNQDVNYLLTLQVSVRIWQIKLIYRGLSHKQLLALHESALGCIIPCISTAVYSNCGTTLFIWFNWLSKVIYTWIQRQPFSWFSMNLTSIQFFNRSTKM